MDCFTKKITSASRIAFFCFYFPPRTCRSIFSFTLSSNPLLPFQQRSAVLQSSTKEIVIPFKGGDASAFEIGAQQV
jgi:hypothetical protein